MIQMSERLQELLSELGKVHPDLKLISAGLVVVGEWVRWKCRYGCRAYGKHFCCPPFAPRPEETRRMLSEYRYAVLARVQAQAELELLPEHPHRALWSSLELIHRTIFQLERAAFLQGYYRAFGMGALPCTLCPTCVAEEMREKGEALGEMDVLRCRHKDIMRPSLEACGIDVFQTLENAGYAPAVFKDYAHRLELFGLVLLE
jgi:predicted metal-binding protein